MKFILLSIVIAVSQCVFLPHMKGGNAFAEIQQVLYYQSIFNSYRLILLILEKN